MELMLENSRRFYAALYWKRRIHIGCQDMLVAAIPPSARFGAANVAMLGAAMTHADIVAAIKDQNTEAHAVAIGPASITPYKYMKFRPRGGAAAPAAPGGCAPASLLRRCRAAC
eukprot:COSAG06_NODE_83_length_25105_cov_69.740913_14_plen_114_part_00